MSKDGLNPSGTIEAKLKHLEFIQGVVSRLASDSFRMKGWSVALAAALFVLLARGGNPKFAPVAFVGPMLIFWGLDGYFLWQERLYRALYDRVRVLEENEIDFSMDVGEFRRECTWPRTMFSRTLIGFYGAVLLMVGFASAVG